MKKYLLFMVLSFSILFAKDINISFIGSGANSDLFWSIIKNAITIAEKETKVKVTYTNPPTGDRTDQARLLQAAIVKRPDAIVVSVADKNALQDGIKHAISLGIPVMSINSGGDYREELGVIMHIGEDSYQSGYQAGLKAKREGVKSFVCINHEITNTTLERRCNGFADGLGVKNDMLDVGFDPSEIEKRVAPKLNSVDAILTMGPVSAIPIINLLSKKKSGKKPYFVTFDLSKEITNGIKSGIVTFAIDQQPFLQGYLPIIFFSQYIKYGVIPTEPNIKTGPLFVEKTNVDKVEKFAGKYR